MPLVKSILQTQINSLMKIAFDDAMKEFMEQMKSGGSVPGVIVSARSAAATKFASKVAPDLATAIDTYIKSATIIVPPGQVVVAPPPAGTGSTTTPSAPATIT